MRVKQFVRFHEMARNTIIFVTILSIILSVSFCKRLPDCDDFIEDAPLSVHEIQDDCHKDCPEDFECLKKCVLEKVEEQGEDGEYLKYIVSNLSTPKTEVWMQELAEELKEKCLPLTEEKKLDEAFECYMKASIGKCSLSA